MILVYTKTGDRQEFRLPSVEREQALLKAWRAIGGDPAFAQKSIKFTHRGGTTKIKIGAIKDIVSCSEAQFEAVEPEIPAEVKKEG